MLLFLLNLSLFFKTLCFSSPVLKTNPPTGLFLSGGIYRGQGERDRPYPCPIMAHRERGHPTLPRCLARCLMGSRLQGTTPLVLHYEGAWVVLGFGFWQCLCKWGREGERECSKKIIQKPSSSPTAH
jgi:hypothetical protein